MFLCFYYFCLQDSRTFSVTKYSMRILKKYPFRADAMLFFFFFFYIGKNNMKNKTFFFPPHHRHIHIYQLMIKKEKRDKTSSLFQVHSGSLAECLEHWMSSVQFPFILCFVSKALFSIQCFYMTFAFEKAQKPLFPLVRFPSRFIDQSFRLIALVKSAKSSSICQYSWQSDWQWNCYFYGRSMLL